MNRASLCIVQPQTRREEFLEWIEKEMILGKNAEAHIQLNDIRCAGIHALIERDEETGEMIITDLGSAYGTFYKGKRKDVIRLREGERFTVGRHQLIYRVLDDENLGISRAQVTNSPQSHSPIDQENAVLLTEKTNLQVCLYWGEQILEQRIFNPGEVVTIGSQKNVTFGVTLGDAVLQKKPFSVAEYKRGRLLLHVPAEAVGIVWIGSDMFSIDTLRHRDKSRKEFGDLKLQLRIGDRADIQFGELTLSFRFISPPEKMPSAMIPELDRTFFKISAGMTALFILVASLLNVASVPTKVVTLEDVPAVLKKAVYDAGISKALMRRKAAIGELARTKDGGRAKGEEGRVSSRLTREEQSPNADPKNKKKKMAKARSQGRVQGTDTPTRHARAPIAPDQQMGSLDMDSVFGAAKKGAKQGPLSMVTAGVPREGNAIAAISDAGGFARGTKGTGGGGGGRGVGIGTLTGMSTGGGMGAGDYGVIPSKGREITAPAENEEIVTLGGLDRDLIAAIIKRNIAQIQFCYEQQLNVNPKLKGKVMVSFIITGKGSVKSADVVESSLRNATVEQCMIGKIMGWKFPEPRGGGTVGVKYPFILMTNTGG